MRSVDPLRRDPLAVTDSFTTDLLAYRPAPDLLRERTVLVTGASDGLGRAVALACAAHGATVVLVGRTQAKLEAVYDAIADAGHPEPAVAPLDFAEAEPEHFRALAGLVDGELGRLDGVVHAAAFLGSLTPIAHYDPALWARVLRVDLTAPFLLTQVCLPLLRRADDASVVFTTCDVGRRGRAYWGAYGVAKFGLEGLMQELAAECEANTPIRANSLDPGPLRTRLRRLAYPGEDAGDLAPPESVVSAFLYLLGADARGVNGRALSVGLVGKSGRRDPAAP
jgi:NAD(P)-dependent dehydrogenase (short-subunit alcohol dehydrogenase family)